VGLLSVLVHRPSAVIFASLLGSFTFVDAWKSGIYKRADRKTFVNLSPMGWGVAMAGLFVVAFPAYLFNRNKLRTIHGTNAYYWAAVAVGAVGVIAIVAALVVGAINISHSRP
jgi:hypothetical protein